MELKHQIGDSLTGLAECLIVPDGIETVVEPSYSAIIYECLIVPDGIETDDLDKLKTRKEKLNRTRWN